MEDNDRVDEYLETERDHILEEVEFAIDGSTEVARLARANELCTSSPSQLILSRPKDLMRSLAVAECSYVNEKRSKSEDGPILYAKVGEESAE
jgi:hypothetical protein